MIKTLGYAAKNSMSGLNPYELERADPKPNEIQIEVLFCGVWHHTCWQHPRNTGCFGLLRTVQRSTQCKNHTHR